MKYLKLYTINISRKNKEDVCFLTILMFVGWHLELIGFFLVLALSQFPYCNDIKIQQEEQKVQAGYS